MNFRTIFFKERAPSALWMSRRTRNSNASSDTARSKRRSRKRGEFFGYGKPGDLALSVPWERGLKRIFSSKRPISSGRKNLCSSEMTARSSVVNGRQLRRKSCWEPMSLGSGATRRATGLSQTYPVTKHRESLFRHKFRQLRHKPAEAVIFAIGGRVARAR